MKYYELRQTSEPKIVGVSDGAGQAFVSNRQFLDNHPWFDAIFNHTESRGRDWWKSWAKITDHAQELHAIPMEKRAKHTDYIFFSGLCLGFIVNIRLREIIRQAHLLNHKFLPASFIQNDKLIEDYWWFVYDRDTGEHTVDFAKCVFRLTNNELRLGKEVGITNYTDYLAAFNEAGSGLRATTLVLNNNFDKELDIFGMQFLASTTVFISERLIKQWQALGIKGYQAYSPEEAKTRAHRLMMHHTDLIFE